jgi:PKD repeat protein
MRSQRISRLATVFGLALGSLVGVLEISPTVALATIPTYATPVLQFQRKIQTTNFVGTNISPKDAEGLAYVPQDNSIWLSDDNNTRLFDIDKDTGVLKNTVTQAQLAAVPQQGGGAPAGTNTASDMEAMAYDPANDVLYAFAGKCCTSGIRAAAFKLVRSGNTFVPVSYQPFTAPMNDFSGVGFINGELFTALGKVIYRYDYATNTFSNPVTFSTVNGGIVGMGFSPDGADLWITSSSNRVYRINWITKQLVPNHDFLMTDYGILDPRAVEVVGDQLFICDGYDSYASTSPERYAIKVFNVVNGAAPAPPVASFTRTPSSGTAPVNVQFTDTSTGVPTSWAWNFGDGSTSALQHPSHAYLAAGTFTVSLTATNANGSTSATSTVSVSTLAAPVASFTNPATGGVGAPISFADTSTNSPTSWAWNFGDGATATTQHPQHAYASTGSYNVTLTASNAGGSSSVTQTISIVAVGPTQTLTPSADSFIATASPTKNYGTFDYLRGLQGYEYRPYLKFDVGALAGPVTSATLRLFVTDATDNVGSWYSVSPSWAETTITAANAPVIGGAPVASTGAAVLGQWIEVNITAAVTGPGSYSFAALPASTNSVRWSSKEGLNPPQLVISTTAGGGGTAPTAAFSFTPNGGVVPLPVQFTDTSTGLPTSWAWNFGDGVTDTVQNPNHVYTTAGTFTVSLTATNGLGSTTTSQTITTTAGGTAPTAAFSFTPNGGVVPLPVQFTDTSTGVPTSWAWNFGDGGTDTVQNPNHVYTTAGTFTVSLTATNGLGSTTTSQTITATAGGGGGGTVAFAPTDDAYVSTPSPAKNFGTALFMRGLAAYEYRPYVKFNVTGLTGAVTSAKIRLYVTDATDNVGNWYSVDSGWTETTLTAGNAPVIGGTPVATVGAAPLNQWVEFDVTAAVLGNGTVSFANLAASTNGVYWSSKEGANPPQLVITTS